MNESDRVLHACYLCAFNLRDNVKQNTILNDGSEHECDLRGYSELNFFALTMEEITPSVWN